MSLHELLGKMQCKGDEEKITFGELLSVMEKRGFGPMLAAPAFICSTPIGAIPGIPTVTGITIFLISLQVLLARNHPWLPSAITQIGINRESLNKGIGKAKPAVTYVDKLLLPRWFFMRQAFFRSLIAVSCAICGLMMVPLELVPFLGLIPAMAIFIMAIGMATDDGAVALLGLSVAILGIVMGTQQLIELVS
ncbi:exopolysaccharide biosynthesis protein [Salinimonas chungwhensis]|uniref:exopolysaccharide biosynthesis protein n=1 Tax=Salinimonas chungwhensis TaxID=265425 RepID=UPI0003A40AC0|nr:exopolysaccharide biosynthesis protein [Salinimonas chungwhensis]